MNTAVIIEPRQLPKVLDVITNFRSVLSTSEWHIVFYCGVNNKSYWEEYINTQPNTYPTLSNIEIRELEYENLTPIQYNDMLKRKDFWESLQGEYILIFQLDTWLNPTSQYTINDFITRQYSYIGGNQPYVWDEFIVLDKLKIPYHQNGSFNGGLSLRKRQDMIKIIEEIPPLPTPPWYEIRKIFESLNYLEIPDPIGAPTEPRILDVVKIMAEDTYFTIGCYILNLNIKEDELTREFACHKIYIKNPFGYHLSIPYPITDPQQIEFTNKIKEDCPDINCLPFYNNPPPTP
jgi:hypothetical protein